MSPRPAGWVASIALVQREISRRGHQATIDRLDARGDPEALGVLWVHVLELGQLGAVRWPTVIAPLTRAWAIGQL